MFIYEKLQKMHHLTKIYFCFYILYNPVYGVEAKLILDLSLFMQKCSLYYSLDS